MGVDLSPSCDLEVGPDPGRAPRQAGGGEGDGAGKLDQGDVVRLDASEVTGGAAKSIQSINVAAAVAAVAAAAVAGLANPAATHSMKKLRVWHKTVLFLSLSFLGQLSLFPMSMLALNSFSGKGGPIKLFLKKN